LATYHCMSYCIRILWSLPRWRVMTLTPSKHIGLWQSYCFRTLSTTLCRSLLQCPRLWSANEITSDESVCLERSRFKHTVFSSNTIYLPSRPRGNERQISRYLETSRVNWHKDIKVNHFVFHVYRLQWCVVVGVDNEICPLFTDSSCCYRELFSQAVFKCTYTVRWICKTAFNTGLILCRWEQVTMRPSRRSLMVWRKSRTMVSGRLLY